MAGTRHGSVQLTTSGQVGNTNGTPVTVYGMNIVASGATAPVVILRNGTSASATAYAQTVGVASVGNCPVWPSEGIYFPAGCYYSADGNQSYVTFSYEQAN